MTVNQDGTNIVSIHLHLGIEVWGFYTQGIVISHIILSYYIVLIILSYCSKIKMVLTLV
jgi:hypothetical protein